AEGATATAPTLRLLIVSVSGTHDAPPSVVFQRPPPSAPAYSVLAAVGCGAMAVMRPAPLVGPSETHVGSVLGCEALDCFCLSSRSYSPRATRSRVSASTSP